jgi:hypothetical protein
MRRSRYFLLMLSKKAIAITLIPTVCPTRTLFDRSLQRYSSRFQQSRDVGVEGS